MYQLVEVSYDLFKSRETCEIEALEERLARGLATGDKLRKAMFARHGEMCKQILELQNRLAIIERGICEGHGR